ncbi:uncharacterized protein [Chelonus insularis]|uniref:uncharacterized protein n=1 Tax=Chelonus insularis TaxID=460826 RepID=UPI00158C555D|nr:uncharacterized protein LOC118074312 [Chelonus insularis]
MILKLQAKLLPRFYVLCIILHTTRAAYIPHLDVEENNDHHLPVASSFMHFHGPVEGPEFEIKIPDLENGYQHDSNHLLGHSHTDHDDTHHYPYTLDYVAHPKYEFSYGVEDHHTGDFHGQKEVRDGTSVSGEYSVKEPGGSIRIVTYKADKDGFHAYVHTSGKNDHTGATYTTKAHTQTEVHDHHVHYTDATDGNYYSQQEYVR